MRLYGRKLRLEHYTIDHAAIIAGMGMIGNKEYLIMYIYLSMDFLCSKKYLTVFCICNSKMFY